METHVVPQLNKEAAATSRIRALEPRTQVNLRLPVSEFEELERRANETGLTKAKLTNAALRFYYKYLDRVAREVETE